MALEAFSFLGLFAITIVIGYIGSVFFKKTGVLDVIWLLLLGLILGPVLGFINREIFIAVLPLLSALALILILFDAGLNMDFYQLVRNFSRSLLLTIFSFVLTTLAVGVFVYYVLNFSIVESMLLGSILGGTSSASVTSIVGKIKGTRSDVRTVLTLESILSDPFTIVIPIALLGLVVPSAQGISADPITSIISAFSIGGMIGLLGGIGWQMFTDRLKERQLEYMLTLAAIFVIYIIVETLHGSGAIAALLFGLVLGNKRTFYSILKIKERSRNVYEGVKATQREVSFFIRSFFFVYLGLIFTINTQYILVGLTVIGLIFLIRILAAGLATYKMDLRGDEKNIIKIIGPRGLATAVMAQIPLSLGLDSGAAILNIGFMVILGTSLYPSVLTFILERKAKNILEKKNLTLKNSVRLRRKPKNQDIAPISI